MSIISLEDVAWKEEGEYCKQSPYGAVIAPDGSLYHMEHKFQHGVIIAVLEPECAERLGFSKPNSKRSLDYQSFEYESAEELGYIRVGVCVFHRISWHYKNKITKEQIDSLSKYLYNNSLMEERFSTDFGSYSGEKILLEFKRLHDHNKMAGEFIRVEPTEEDLENLVEPSGLFNR